MEIRQVEFREIEPYAAAVKAEGAGTLSRTCLYYGIEVDGKLASFSGLKMKGKKAVMTNSYTLPEFRGRGLHTVLLRYRIDKAREIGAERIVGSCTPASLGIKLKEGFVEARKTPSGYTKVEMELN